MLVIDPRRSERNAPTTLSIRGQPTVSAIDPDVKLINVFAEELVVDAGESRLALHSEGIRRWSIVKFQAPRKILTVIS